MAEQIALIPLNCIQCETAVPADPGETAWVCRQCGQGLVLDEEAGLRPLVVYYQAGITQDKKGFPFWVVEGKVQLSRQVYGGRSDAQAAEAFWGVSRRFFVPAYTCPIETLVALGPRMLLSPPLLQPGPAVQFEPVTLPVEDIQPMAELIALAIEADRKDKLKQVQLRVALSDPVLWVLGG
jgi:hypothetical protein